MSDERPVLEVLGPEASGTLKATLDPGRDRPKHPGGQPLSHLPDEPAEGEPEPGVGLCLSGGGYRAMLFHVGCLWRLNEAGYLPRFDRISSVSGGSIVAAQLAVAWPNLDFSDGVGSRFVDDVVAPLRRLAGETIDLPAIIRGLLMPARTGEKLAATYRKHLFGSRTLQDLPDTPRFVINATNLQSAVLWRFSKPYMRDYRVGSVEHPTVELATAVAASAALPPWRSA